MATTFREAWRAVKLQVPLADPMLCRKWVQYAYNELADRYPWHFLYQETILSTAASRTITAAVTQGSTAVTSAAAFVATDLNRQIRVGSGAIYTIVTFTDASNVVIDQSYADVDNATASVVISDRYVRTPADFGSWDTIIDQSRQRPIQTSYSQADLQSWDPARTETGEPRILVALDVDTTDRVRYEWWPHPTAAQHYPALYKSRPQALADSFTFRGVLGDRQDVLVAGALVRASQWPGTEQHRNPYFVLGLNQQLKADWQQAIHSLGLRTMTSPSAATAPFRGTSTTKVGPSPPNSSAPPMPRWMITCKLPVRRLICPESSTSFKRPTTSLPSMPQAPEATSVVPVVVAPCPLARAARPWSIAHSVSRSSPSQASARPRTP